MNLIENARSIALKAHAGQYRRDGVTAYFEHLCAVAHRLSKESPEVVATAWLHDVLEDTDENAESLLEEGIPRRVIEAVQVLTKTGEDYQCYLNRVKAHPIARKVKVADMLANLADDPTKKQIVKYTRGLLFLGAQ